MIFFHIRNSKKEQSVAPRVNYWDSEINFFFKYYVGNILKHMGQL